MDKEFEELKGLFQQKKASVTLSTEGIEKKAKHDLSKLRQNHIANIIMLLSTAIVLIVIDKINSEKIETSSWGLFILLTCSLYYALSKSYLLYRLNAIKPTHSVLHTIEQLERYKRLNTFMHTYGEMMYTLVLCIGIYLYINPVMDIFLLNNREEAMIWLWGIWGALIAWLLFYNFVIKRRRMKSDIQIIENYLKALKTNESL
ncbi:hypothetical protein [Sediminibacterium sp. C3]|uniref:hypothetical protein n=1 Tax=Sediminibacterium sp. C3 TaxID=1267211 RepID=UPI0003F6122A|nr:hypothetical protein [Sediminibacterium sp. C3]